MKETKRFTANEFAETKRFTANEFAETYRQAREDVRELMEGVALLLPTLDRLYYGVVAEEEEETPRRTAQKVS